MTKVLIVGNIDNIHIRKLNEYLNRIKGDNIELNFFHLGYSDYKGLENAIAIQKHFHWYLYKISGLASLLFLLDFYFSFRKIKEKYNLINLHYLTYHSYFLLPLYKLKGSKIMISPWGSDVNRVSGFKKFLFQKVYNKADWISVPQIEFRKIIQDKFKVPTKKIIDVGFGSDMIDYILTQKHITKQRSKNILGLNNNFVIACGYNRSSAQNHNIMIDTMVLNSHNLPPKTVLIFLLTYGDSYDLSLSFQKLDQNNIEYILFENFMDKQMLFNIQNATDLFIHIQNTDANSAFMQEFLLCDALVINGGWLKYSHLEKNGPPYIKVEEKTVESLSLALQQSLKLEKVINSSYAKSVISDFAWSSQIKKWYSFLKELKV